MLCPMLPGRHLIEDIQVVVQDIEVVVRDIWGPLPHSACSIGPLTHVHKHYICRHLGSLKFESASLSDQSFHKKVLNSISSNKRPAF